MAAAADMGVYHFGSRALMSIRLKKNYGAWMEDFREDFTPVKAGLDAFVAYDKNADFIGKAAVLAEREKGIMRRCVNLVIVADADANGDEPIYKDERYADFVTSGGYGYYVSQSFAIGYIDVALDDEQGAFTVEISGERRMATIQQQPAYDLTSIRMCS